MNVFYCPFKSKLRALIRLVITVDPLRSLCDLRIITIISEITQVHQIHISLFVMLGYREFFPY